MATAVTISSSTHEATHEAKRSATSIIVLGSAYSGIAILRQALMAQDGVAWIDAPGLVHLGHQVARIWSRVDGRRDSTPGAASGMARNAIGTMLQSMLLGRLALEGGEFWASTTVPSPREGLDFFARMFPSAKFVCLHRRCDQVIEAVLAAYPWGMAGDGTGFDNFVMMHPWSPAAAIAEYWATHTEVLTRFEADNPARCLRVRHEDMLANPDDTASSIADFTGMVLRISPVTPMPGTPLAANQADDRPRNPERIPAELLARVNSLTGELGYPLLGSVKH